MDNKYLVFIITILFCVTLFILPPNFNKNFRWFFIGIIIVMVIVSAFF